MRRFFVEEINAKKDTCTITGSEARHMVRVLRMRPGDRFILTDSAGARFQAVIESIKSHEVSIRIEKSLPKPPPSPVEIILCQALLKSRPMDYLVQKTSELGMNRIFPFSSERTVVRLEGMRLQNRLRHWRNIAHNAAKQSGRATPAEIGPLSEFKDLMSQFDGTDALKVFLWEEEGTRDLKEVLKNPLQKKRFVGLIGPEGGFSREEVELAIKAGFVSVSLGYRILRAETAAITLGALVQYELGDLTRTSRNPI